jgi:hypothetical protein
MPIFVLDKDFIFIIMMMNYDDYEYPSEEMVEVRDEVEEYLEKKYHDYLVDIYNDLVKDCN